MVHLNIDLAKWHLTCLVNPIVNRCRYVLDKSRREIASWQLKVNPIIIFLEQVNRSEGMWWRKAPHPKTFPLFRCNEVYSLGLKIYMYLDWIALQRVPYILLNMFKFAGNCWLGEWIDLDFFSLERKMWILYRLHRHFEGSVNVHFYSLHIVILWESH